MTLTEEELERYSRQLVLPEWSGEAQERLKAAQRAGRGRRRAGLARPRSTSPPPGVGGWGSSTTSGSSAPTSPARSCTSRPTWASPRPPRRPPSSRFLNPAVIVEPYPARLDAANAGALVAGFDLVVDCSDSFATRYEVNDACCAAGIDLVEGGVLGLGGLVLSVRPGDERLLPLRVPDRAARGQRARPARRPASSGRSRA